MGAVNLFTDQIDSLGKDDPVAELLAQEAAKVQSRVRRIRGMTIDTRKGVSSRDAFAQVVMSGQGALAVEFGSSKNPPYAPLRSALRGGG